jgi:hypothetical protein
MAKWYWINKAFLGRKIQHRIGRGHGHSESAACATDPVKTAKRTILTGLTIGGGGIRTPDTVSRVTVFKTVAFSHSATPPQDIRSCEPSSRVLQERWPHRPGGRRHCSPFPLVATPAERLLKLHRSAGFPLQRCRRMSAGRTHVLSAWSGECPSPLSASCGSWVSPSAHPLPLPVCLAKLCGFQEQMISWLASLLASHHRDEID